MLYSQGVLYADLPVSAQTAYAQLLDATASRELRRTAASLSGTFSSKKVGNARYWYYTYRLPGAGVQQAFVGPDSERVRRLIENAAQPGSPDVAPLVRAYAVQGGSPSPPQQTSLLQHLADAGFFTAGGVLVGTHAFLAYANLLGVRWGGHDQTTDIDLGWSDKSLSIAVPASPKANLHDALSTFESGFVPSHVVGKSIGAAYHSVKDPEFRVDFLTTLTRSGPKPRLIEPLNIVAQPLPFMEFSLESPVQSVVFDGRGRAVLANVPPPARFAIHKLIVTQQRTVMHRAKIAKDFAQAASLIAWFADHDPESMEEARKTAALRGPAWRKSLRAGIAALKRLYPALRGV